MLKNWLTCTSHICEDRLPKVPSKELIGYAVGIFWVTTYWVENSTIKTKNIDIKDCDLVVIL